MKKRILSMLLALLMIISVVPLMSLVSFAETVVLPYGSYKTDFDKLLEEYELPSFVTLEDIKAKLDNYKKMDKEYTNEEIAEALATVSLRYLLDEDFAAIKAGILEILNADENQAKSDEEIVALINAKYDATIYDNYQLVYQTIRAGINTFLNADTNKADFVNDKTPAAKYILDNFGIISVNGKPAFVESAYNQEALDVITNALSPITDSTKVTNDAVAAAFYNADVRFKALATSNTKELFARNITETFKEIRNNETRGQNKINDFYINFTDVAATGEQEKFESYLAYYFKAGKGNYGYYEDLFYDDGHLVMFLDTSNLNANAAFATTTGTLNHMGKVVIAENQDAEGYSNAYSKSGIHSYVKAVGGYLQGNYFMISINDGNGTYDSKVYVNEAGYLDTEAPDSFLEAATTVSGADFKQGIHIGQYFTYTQTKGALNIDRSKDSLGEQNVWYDNGLSASADANGNYGGWQMEGTLNFEVAEGEELYDDPDIEPSTSNIFYKDNKSNRFGLAELGAFGYNLTGSQSGYAGFVRFVAKYQANSSDANKNWNLYFEKAAGKDWNGTYGTDVTHYRDYYIAKEGADTFFSVVSSVAFTDPRLLRGTPDVSLNGFEDGTTKTIWEILPGYVARLANDQTAKGVRIDDGYPSNDTYGMVSTYAVNYENIRIYDCKLTEEQTAQNHAAELMYTLGLDYKANGYSELLKTAEKYNSTGAVYACFEGNLIMRTTEKDIRASFALAKNAINDLELSELTKYYAQNDNLYAEFDFTAINEYNTVTYDKASLDYARFLVPDFANGETATRYSNTGDHFYIRATRGAIADYRYKDNSPAYFMIINDRYNEGRNILTTSEKILSAVELVEKGYTYNSESNTYSNGERVYKFSYKLNTLYAENPEGVTLSRNHIFINNAVILGYSGSESLYKAKYVSYGWNANRGNYVKESATEVENSILVQEGYAVGLDGKIFAWEKSTSEAARAAETPDANGLTKWTLSYYECEEYDDSNDGFTTAVAYDYKNSDTKQNHISLATAAMFFDNGPSCSSVQNGGIYGAGTNLRPYHYYSNAVGLTNADCFGGEGNNYNKNDGFTVEASFDYMESTGAERYSNYVFNKNSLMLWSYNNGLVRLTKGTGNDGTNRIEVPYKAVGNYNQSMVMPSFNIAITGTFVAGTNKANQLFWLNGSKLNATNGTGQIGGGEKTIGTSNNSEVVIDMTNKELNYVRIYTTVLTEDELARNNFIDLCRYYGIYDLDSFYGVLSETKQQAVANCFKGVTFGYLGLDSAETLRTLIDNAIKYGTEAKDTLYLLATATDGKTVMDNGLDFVGFQARTNTNFGIRSVYTVNETALSSFGKANSDIIGYGILVGEWSENKTFGDFTVDFDGETVSSDNSQFIYHKLGASDDGFKYFGESEFAMTMASSDLATAERAFAYTVTDYTKDITANKASTLEGAGLTASDITNEVKAAFNAKLMFRSFIIVKAYNEYNVIYLDALSENYTDNNGAVSLTDLANYYYGKTEPTGEKYSSYFTINYVYSLAHPGI